MSENLDLKTIETVDTSPFKKLVMTIGELPTSFIESMTYYEALAWFVNYLENTIIPTVNNNAEAVEELQGLFTVLHDYVHNYFDNLDVQQEINNKLDEMAEDGTLGLYFKKYVDPVMEQFNDELNTKIDTNVATLQSQISGLASGSPLTASSTSGMTDTTRIYVNTTDGKWYYYNGASWVEGGTYQSTGLADGSVGLKNISTDLTKFNLYSPKATLVSETRIRISDRPYFRAGSVLEFDIPEGYQWTIVKHVYDPSYSYQTVLNWTATTTKYVVEADARYEITFKKTGDLELLETDIPTVLAALKCYRVVKNEGNNVLEYYVHNEGAFEITEHFTNSGTNNNIKLTSNSSHPAFYFMGENYVEYTNVRGWSADNKTHHPFTYLTYELSTYGTATESASGGHYVTSLEVIIPNNYALVVNTVTAVVSVKQYSTVEPNEIMLIRNSNGYCGGGIFQTINNDVAMRKAQNDISSLQTAVSAISAGGNFDDIVKGINHRGYTPTAPENTIPAFQESKKQGFKYVETDISFTSDRVPVLLHDNTIDRTSNGTGNIGDMTYDQVSQYDFGSWKSEVYAGTKIPTLQEFLVLCRNLGLHPYLELKNGQNPTEAEIQGIVDMVEACGMKGKVTYISFLDTLLSYVKNYDSEARIGYIPNTNTITQTYINKAVALKTDDNEVFFDPDHNNVDNTVITMCKSADLPLEVWTVDSEATIIGLDAYITGVTSNRYIAGKVLYEDSIE